MHCKRDTFGVQCALFWTWWCSAFRRDKNITQRMAKWLVSNRQQHNQCFFEQQVIPNQPVVTQIKCTCCCAQTLQKCTHDEIQTAVKYKIKMTMQHFILHVTSVNHHTCNSAKNFTSSVQHFLATLDHTNSTQTYFYYIYCCDEKIRCSTLTNCLITYDDYHILPSCQLSVTRRTCNLFMCIVVCKYYILKQWN